MSPAIPSGSDYLESLIISGRGSTGFDSLSQARTFTGSDLYPRSPPPDLNDLTPQALVQWYLRDQDQLSRMTKQGLIASDGGTTVPRAETVPEDMISGSSKRKVRSRSLDEETHDEPQQDISNVDAIRLM